MPVPQLTILGVGLLGGSVGLAAKARHAALHVRGVGRDERNLVRALSAGAIDSYSTDVAEGVGGEFGVVGFHDAVRRGRSKSGAGCSRSRARSFFSPVWMRKPMFVTVSFVTSAISR